MAIALVTRTSRRLIRHLQGMRRRRCHTKGPHQALLGRTSRNLSARCTCPLCPFILFAFSFYFLH